MAEEKTEEIIEIEPDEDGGARYRLPYGIAKGLGLNTDGMTPREVWNMLKKRGVNPDNEYEKLKEKAEVKIEDDKHEQVDADRTVKTKTVVKSKAFATLRGTVKSKIEKTIGELSSEQLGIISKYIDKLSKFTQGSGECQWGGGPIRFDQSNNGTALDKELGYDFDACTFFHEYGHFVDNMVGMEESKSIFGMGSDTVSMKEDGLYAFNIILKEGGYPGEVSNISKITREQREAFYKGLAKITGKDQMKPYQSRTKFGYIEEPSKPLYTPERARDLFGADVYESAKQIWEIYRLDYEKYQIAEKDGTNAKALENWKKAEQERLEFNKPIGVNIQRFGILTDFFGMWTNNRINPREKGYWGHKTGYNKTAKSQTETWAEYFSFKMTNDTKGLEIMEKFFPKTYKEFEEKYNKL